MSDTRIPKKDPLASAIQRVAAFGDDAMLTATEAAAVLNMSRSTFDRQGFRSVDSGERTQRYRYGTLRAAMREREAA